MKKPSLWLLAAVILLYLFSLQTGYGISQKETAAPAGADSNSLTIVTSFYPMYIMTINITKDIPGVEVINMTKPFTGCLHDYQLTPEDLMRLEKAGFFVINGAELESFLDKVVRQLPDLKIIEAGRGIALIEGENEEEVNPHIWVSLAGAIQEVNNIAGQLAVLDPAHGEQYIRNAAAYTARLEELRQRMHRELSGLNSREVVTFHEAFPYFTREFNLTTAAVVEREPGSEPTGAELAQTIQLIRKAQVKAIFIEPQYPAKAAQTIAQETGAVCYTLDPAVSGPLEPHAYLNIMEENLKTLKAALK